MARTLNIFYLYRFLGESFFFYPVFWLFLEQRGMTPAEILLLNTFFCAVVVLFQVPTGLLADRFGRRPAMIAGSLSMASACLMFYFSRSFAAFAVSESLLALGWTLASGADSAYLYDGLADSNRADEYARREGTATGFKHAGYALACIVGGLLGLVDLALPYLVTAMTCLGAAGVAVFLREPRGVRSAGNSSSISQAVSLVRSNEDLRWVISYSAALFCLVGVGLYLYQPTLREAGYDVAWVGLIFGARHMLAAWSAHRAGRLRARVGESALVMGLPIILAVGYLVLSWAAVWWCLLVLILQALAQGVYSPLAKDMVQREISDSRVRATVLSLEAAVRRIAFGLVLTPLLAVVFRAGGGLSSALLATGGMGIVAMLLLFGLRKRQPATLEPLSSPTPAHAHARPHARTGTD